MRQKITLDMDTMTLATEMSEGNPGGLSVVVALLKKELPGLMCLLNLDDMNIRGCQIWVGYKDYCKEDLNAFIKAAQERDPKMVEMINANCLYDGYTEMAVTGGASYKNVPDSSQLTI